MKFLQDNGIYRYYHSRSDAMQMLLLCTFFSMGLLLARMVYTGHLLFAFLAWNLLLAAIPLAITGHLRRQARFRKGIFLLSSIAWLLFIPNSFYIITDLFHLGMNEVVPLWFDLALLLSFAWTGILYGIVSVREMECFLQKWTGRDVGLFFILPVMFLNALGVYVGRYMRYNSWDIITDPLQLIMDILYLCIHPIRNVHDWSMITCYTALLLLIYQTVKKLSRMWV